MLQMLMRYVHESYWGMPADNANASYPIAYVLFLFFLGGATMCSVFAWHLKIIGDGILKKISYVLKSVQVWSLKVCK